MVAFEHLAFWVSFIGQIALFINTHLVLFFLFRDNLCPSRSFLFLLRRRSNAPKYHLVPDGWRENLFHSWQQSVGQQWSRFWETHSTGVRVQLKATLRTRPSKLLECCMAAAGQSYCQSVGVTVMICDEAMRLARSMMDKAIICKLSLGGKQPRRCNWKLFFRSLPCQEIGQRRVCRLFSQIAVPKFSNPLVKGYSSFWWTSKFTYRVVSSQSSGAFWIRPRGQEAVECVACKDRIQEFVATTYSVGVVFQLMLRLGSSHRTKLKHCRCLERIWNCVSVFCLLLLILRGHYWRCHAAIVFRCYWLEQPLQLFTCRAQSD